MKSLQDDLESLIQRRVEQELQKISFWKEAYFDLISDIECELFGAESLVEDFNKNDLTLSAIESEGFLRCAITVRNMINSSKEDCIE